MFNEGGNPNTNQTPDTVRTPDESGIENTPSKAGDQQTQDVPLEYPARKETPVESPTKS